MCDHAGAHQPRMQECLRLRYQACKESGGDAYAMVPSRFMRNSSPIGCGELEGIVGTSLCGIRSDVFNGEVRSLDRYVWRGFGTNGVLGCAST